jgi:hypothetical protein
LFFDAPIYYILTIFILLLLYSLFCTRVNAMSLLSPGSARRTTASTQMNAESSRSHLICSLVVRLTNKRTGKESLGKLTLVDLAGSEVRLLCSSLMSLFCFV